MSFYLSSLGFVALGLLALLATINKEDCHYKRETWAGIGTYLIASGIFRIVSTAFGMEQSFSRQITGYMAFFATAGAGITSIHHFLFHWLLHKAGVLDDPK